MWEQAEGPILDGLHVLHHCDQPLCYRFDHLFLGTQADNAADRDRKGRLVRSPGERNGRAKLTADDVVAIRAASGGNKALANRYGVALSTVENIRAGQTWKHLLDRQPVPGSDYVAVLTFEARP